MGFLDFFKSLTTTKQPLVLITIIVVACLTPSILLLDIANKLLKILELLL